MNADLSRWIPQPRAPGMSYISAEMKATIDLSESRVGQDRKSTRLNSSHRP